MYVTQRLSQLISSNACTVGATAVKVSGGVVALTITGATNFIPSMYRQAVIITNTHATQNLFISGSASVTNAAGGGWSKELLPGEMIEYLFNGSVQMYVVGSGAGTSFTMEEYQ